MNSFLGVGLRLRDGCFFAKEHLLTEIRDSWGHEYCIDRTFMGLGTNKSRFLRICRLILEIPSRETGTINQHLIYN